MKTRVNSKKELIITVSASEIKPLVSSIDAVCDLLASYDFVSISDEQKRAFLELVELIKN